MYSERDVLYSSPELLPRSGNLRPQWAPVRLWQELRGNYVTERHWTALQSLGGCVSQEGRPLSAPKPKDSTCCLCFSGAPVCSKCSEVPGKLNLWRT